MSTHSQVGSSWYGGATYSDEVCDNIYNGSFPQQQEEIQKTVAKVGFLLLIPFNYLFIGLLIYSMINFEKLNRAAGLFFFYFFSIL